MVAASASQLVVTSPPPNSVTAGSGFGVTVSAEDRFGNVDPTYTGSVMLSLAGNPGGSSLSGTVTVPASGGVATFSGLTLDQAAAGYLLDASSGGLTRASSGPIAVSAAPASQLVVSAQPPGSVNAASGFGLVALAEDPFGNVDTQFGGTATLALASNPGNASLGGTISVPASRGVANFSGVTISQGGSGYTLVVTGSGLNGAVTSAIAVVPPPATVGSVTLQTESIARHKKGTVIVIAFKEPLNATAAANVGAYTLSDVRPRQGAQEQGDRPVPGELQPGDEHGDPHPPQQAGTQCSGAASDHLIRIDRCDWPTVGWQ